MAPESTCCQADSSRRGRPPSRERLARGLEAGSFFLLLMVAGMRPLLSETYESGLDPIAQVMDVGGTPTPAATAWFDLAIWLAALGATISAALGRMRWRWTGLEAGWGLLALGAVVSTAAASNKRLALNASFDWLTAIIMAVVLVHLLRDRLRVTLLLAVIVASGLASAAKSVMQVSVEFAETRAWYDQNKAEIWRRQGISLDDPRVDASVIELFEGRMDAREATGFFPHSNTQGAWLGLAGFAALGALGLAGRSRWFRVVVIMLAIALFSAILTTSSRGAMVAAAAGAALWLLLRFVQPAVRRHWRAVLVGAWLTVILAAAAVFAIGSARGGLPGASLTFRWNYWQVTRGILAEHLWTGVGALNFDRAYMVLKPVAFPEEIKDPHNFVFAILSQWGIAGGVGLALMLVGGSLAVARTWGRRREDDLKPVPEPRAAALAKHWIVALIAGFVVLRLWMSPGRLDDAEGRALMVFDLGLYGLVWAFGLAATVGLAKLGNADNLDRCRLACLCGVLAFLLHNTIDFALFYPGALTAFAALSGVLLARGQGAGSDEPRVIPRLVPTLVSIVGLIALTGWVLVPVTRSSYRLAQARGSSLDTALGYYRAAAAGDPFDPTPFVELALRCGSAGGVRNLTTALAALDEAARRDPDRLMIYQWRSKLLVERHEATGSSEDLRAAREAALTALRMYPNSPDGHAALAAVLETGARAFGSAEWAREAGQHYQHALELDAARLPGEIRRWTPARRQWLQQRLNRLGSAPSTVPATRPAGVHLGHLAGYVFMTK